MSLQGASEEAGGAGDHDQHGCSIVAEVGGGLTLDQELTNYLVNETRLGGHS
jgi:hypothetical protein